MPHPALRRATVAITATVASVAVTTGSASAAPIYPADLSPAQCNIVFIDDPHASVSTPGTVKVNAKTQCRAKVTELTLSVSILDVETHVVVAKTVVKTAGRAYIQNQQTLVQCKDRTPHLLEGTALGMSFEDGKLYDQIKVGRVAKVYCGY